MIEKLACKLGRNDELPNIELAETLCKNNDATGIKEIVEGFKGKDKAVTSDCIKVLYEIGGRNPRLIADYAKDFLSHLKSKDNRLVWGCMTALSAVAEYAPDVLFDNLPQIISAYENGSVITVDNSISVFAKLCKAKKEYSDVMFPLILKHLSECRSKEVPQHAERAVVCVNSDNKQAFYDVLEKRKPELTAAQMTRVNKLQKKL